MDRRRILMLTAVIPGDLTPHTVARMKYVDNSLAAGEDEINGGVYRVSAKVGEMWINVPSTANGTMLSFNSTKILCEDAEAHLPLTAGQYQVTITYTGNSDLTGSSREVTADVLSPDDITVSSISVWDTQIGNTDIHTLVIPGLAVPASGQYKLVIQMSQISGLGASGLLKEITLDRVEVTA